MITILASLTASSSFQCALSTAFSFSALRARLQFFVVPRYLYFVRSFLFEPEAYGAANETQPYDGYLVPRSLPVPPIQKKLCPTMTVPR